MAHTINTQILERREVRRWKKALKAEPGLMLCGKRILQHCDRLALLLLLIVFLFVCYATDLFFCFASVFILYDKKPCGHYQFFYNDKLV